MINASDLTYGFELETRNKPTVIGKQPADVARGTDGSVPHGYEYRTKRGYSMDKIIRIADSLFRHLTNPLIDNGCSFHIHIRSEDLTVNHGRRQLILELAEQWMLANRSEWPNSLWQRMRSTYSGCHFSPLDGDFIRVNEDYGKPTTLEFRCFGNVKTTEEAIKCFKLAEMAYCQALYQYKQLDEEGVL